MYFYFQLGSFHAHGEHFIVEPFTESESSKGDTNAHYIYRHSHPVKSQSDCGVKGRIYVVTVYKFYIFMTGADLAIFKRRGFHTQGSMF